MSRNVVVFCSMVAVLIALTINSGPARADLLGYWSFDDDSSPTVVTDYSGKAVHGTAVGGPSYAPGHVDQAMDFGTNANGQYVQVLDAALHDGALDSVTAKNQATVSLWVYGDPATQPAVDTVFEFGTSANREMLAHLPYSDGTIYWDVGGGYTTNVHRISRNEPDASKWEGQWNHYAFVKDGDHSQIYQNGQLWHSGTTTAPIGEIVLGRIAERTSSSANSYGGRIDEFAVYDEALSETQIAALFDGTSSPAGAVSNHYYRTVMADQPFVYYQFDGDSGIDDSPVWDSSGFGRNGVYQQGDTVMSSDQPTVFGGTAPHFEPGNGSNRVAGTTDQPSGAISFEAWVKSDTELWNAIGPLVSKRESFIMHPRNDATTLQFYFRYQNGSNPDTWASLGVNLGTIPDFTLTDWHHYAGTFDPDAGVVSIYVDGVLRARNSNVGTGLTFVTTTAPMYIGFDTSDRYFDGLIDEVAVYDYVLSEERIMAHFRAAVPEPSAVALLLLGIGLVLPWRCRCNRPC